MPRALQARGIRYSRRRAIRPAGADTSRSARRGRTPPNGILRPVSPETASAEPHAESRRPAATPPNGSGKASRPLKTRKRRNPEKARLRKNAGGGGENENMQRGHGEVWKRIRTAVQGFADLCLATRPSDQLSVPSRAADYNYNTNSNLFSFWIRPSRTGKNRSSGTRTAGRFGASGVQIYKHFQNLQNFRRTLRYFVRGFMLFRKNHLYFVKRIQRAMSPKI